MVNVEQHALSAFGQDLTAAGEGRMDERKRVRHKRAQRSCGLGIFRPDLGRVERRRAVFGRQGSVDVEGVRFDRLAKGGRIAHCPGPQPNPRGLVHIGKADSALGGSEAASGALAGGVQGAVPGQDDVSGRADPQSGGGDPQAGRFDLGDFAQQIARIEHHTIADHVDAAFAENPGRDRVQLDHPRSDGDRMAGVVAAVETRDDIGPRGQRVGDPALSFIAPLGAQQNG